MSHDCSGGARMLSPGRPRGPPSGGYGEGGRVVLAPPPQPLEVDASDYTCWVGSANGAREQVVRVPLLSLEVFPLDAAMTKLSNLPPAVKMHRVAQCAKKPQAPSPAHQDCARRALLR